MFTQQEIALVRSTVMNLVGCTYADEIQVTEGFGLTVTLEGGKASIAAVDKPALARGYFLLAQALKAGQSALHLHEEKCFESCGPYIDCSRNGVMTAEACKRYIDYTVALGLNLVVLYTEDTYTVPEYPYLGYLRGRYTPEELKEIDDYADALGVELMPNVQTLAHLGQFLQWKPNEYLKDQPTVLMIDEPDSYTFIEAEIRAMRGCLRSKRIHIGMDEAHGVGLGQYYDKHGPSNRFEMLSRHLDKVVAICKKYDFHPIMWSDMFFRLGSKTNEYYDMDADIPQSVIDSLPDVDLCYWDYYHTDAAMYEHMLSQHEKMNANTAFAGGIWTWSGFLPHVNLTRNSMTPALKACAKHKVRTVMATMWGDDGTEIDYFLALSQLPIFSEYCWRGEACSDAIIAEVGEFLTGLPKNAYEAFSLLYPGDADVRTGKGLMYCDLLYPMMERDEKMEDCLPRFEKARQMLAPYQDNTQCIYADQIFAICEEKAKILRDTRAKYLAGDKAYLADLANSRLPALLGMYENMVKLHRAQWEASYKRNGWEVIALRYGAVVGRLKDVQYAIERYVKGELSTLCELDEEPLNCRRKAGMQFYNVFVSPTFSLL